MKEEHQQIIDEIAKWMEKYPDQRFGQALFNLGVNEFVNGENPEAMDYRIRDIYNDQDEEIIERIKQRLDWLDFQ